MSENVTDNDNWQLPDKPSFSDVEELANLLCDEFNNRQFFAWYCLIINVLGLNRVKEIRDMYFEIPDKQKSAKLFSVRASQESKKKVGISKYQALKSKYARRS